MTKFPRAHIAAALGVGVLCGLFFASGMDLTRFSWAQNRSTTTSKPSAQVIAPLIESQNAFEAIAEKAEPAVVSIHIKKYADQMQPTARRGQGQGRGNRGLDTTQIPPELRQFFGPQGGAGAPDSDAPMEGTGSGFIVSPDGLILTNNHVVEDADTVVVRLYDKREFGARVIGRDPTTDVAVIKINAGGNLPTLPLGTDAGARVGQWVLAIGDPLDLDFTVTAGIISAKGRASQELAARMGAASITDYIQTDAAINPGNSGGPLVDVHGNVIGINSAIASGTGYYAGYGFAIPITLAKEVMDDIVKYGKVRRAILGVHITEVGQDEAEVAGLKQIGGALVTDFSSDDPKDSPAAAAGLKTGDVIIAANGQPVDKVSTLQRIIRGFQPGQSVNVDAMRYGEKKSFTIKLGELPPDATAPTAALSMNGGRGAGAPSSSAVAARKLGVGAETLTQQSIAELKLPVQHRSGVLVTSVSSRGTSFEKQMPERTVIDKVLYPTERDIEIRLPDLDESLSAAKAGSVIQLLVYDAGSASSRPVAIRLP